MYSRILKSTIKQKFLKGKAIVIIGARQTGKTTLAQEIISDFKTTKTQRYFNGDNPTDRELLTNKDLEFLINLIGQADIIFIDEGQKITTIGQTVKLLVDHYKKNKQIVITGSSSIHLLEQTEEPLTGRKFVYTLFPLSLEERYPTKDFVKITKELESLLIFGSYPEVASLSSFEEKIELLKEINSSYLYKDIFEFQGVKHPDVITRLLKALALQIGSEVSLNELSNILTIDKKTVERYIDLLEKNFVIFRLPPYTKNKRREISKLKKIFFYDLGIRNAILQNFQFLDSRNDGGGLWENFMMVERLKYRAHHKIDANAYFWRTYDGQEVDLVEEQNGLLHGYEFKWKEPKKTKPPGAWAADNSNTYKIISPNQLTGFVL